MLTTPINHNNINNNGSDQNMMQMSISNEAIAVEMGMLGPAGGGAHLTPLTTATTTTGSSSSIVSDSSGNLGSNLQVEQSRTDGETINNNNNHSLGHLHHHHQPWSLHQIP